MSDPGPQGLSSLTSPFLLSSLTKTSDALDFPGLDPKSVTSATLSQAPLLYPYNKGSVVRWRKPVVKQPWNGYHGYHGLQSSKFVTC